MGLGLGSHRCLMTWRASPFLSGPSFRSSLLPLGILVSEGQDSATRCSRAFLSAPPHRRCDHEATCYPLGRWSQWSEARWVPGRRRPETGMSRGRRACPEPTITTPTQKKNGHCGVSLRMLTTLARPRRAHKANQFLHCVSALVLEMTARGGGVLLSGALRGHRPSSGWPAPPSGVTGRLRCSPANRDMVSTLDVGQRQLPGVLPSVGHPRLVSPSGLNREQ